MDTIEIKGNRGGARPGSGRPKGIDTVTVRIPASMADAVKIMAKAVREGLDVDFRIKVPSPK